MWESGLALSFISFLKIDICFCGFRHFHLNASLIIFTSLAMESTSLFNLLYYFVYTKSLFSKIFRAFRNSRRHYFVCFRKDNHIVNTATSLFKNTPFWLFCQWGQNTWITLNAVYSETIIELHHYFGVSQLSKWTPPMSPYQETIYSFA